LRAGEWLAPALLVAVFVLIALFVNPLREALTEDDSWLYAQTAQRFANEGTYRLHSYATANMPVQIYWSAALSKLFGFSLVTLRLSTLVLSCLGLLAFYGLLRDLGLTHARAVGLALVYLCNPYALIFSYSFMTDVQFLSWMMVALFFYARGLRSNCIWRVLGGSLAAAAAIGTRQFGVMLIGGMVLCWACDPDRRQKVWIYGAGLVFATWRCDMARHLVPLPPDVDAVGCAALAGRPLALGAGTLIGRGGLASGRRSPVRHVVSPPALAALARAGRAFVAPS
jgi:4-amino-4-deoxy-L-arabinose transferase-like glycosyltransferase